MDGYFPQKGFICYQDDAAMNAKNLTSAKQECSTNINCTMFTDLCGDGDYFIWCRAGDVPRPDTSGCNSVLYVKNNWYK